MCCCVFRDQLVPGSRICVRELQFYRQTLRTTSTALQNRCRLLRKVSVVRDHAHFTTLTTVHHFFICRSKIVKCFLRFI